MNISTLQAFDNVNTAIEYAKMQYGAYPANNLRKPVLAVRHNKQDIEKYLAEYSEYEELSKKIDKRQKAYNQQCNEINALIIEFIIVESGLDKIPEQYRDKVYSKAYENGHGCGFYEIYLELCSLVSIFS